VIGLACCLACAFSAFGQQTEVAPPELTIKVLQGQNAVNVINKRSRSEPRIQVTDEQERPVSGIMVIFTAPESGASGTYADGSRRLIVYTDTDGYAIARGFTPNTTAGSFSITVDASFRGLAARANITQTNGVRNTSGKVSSKLLAILAVAGGAAAVGLVASSKGDSSQPSTATSSSSASRTSIIPGTLSFGAP
jgi:hypothetical protein